VIAAVSVSLAMLFTIGYLATDEWFGRGDLPAMLSWSAIFSVPLSIILSRLARRTDAWRVWVRCVVLVLVGATIGMVWFFLLYLVLSELIYTLSFPSGLIWMASGAGAGGFAALVGERTTGKQLEAPETRS
jgi:cyanate permease